MTTTNPTVDWAKPIQTSDNRSARYIGKTEADIAWLPKHRYVVEVSYPGKPGECVMMYYKEDGTANGTEGVRIVNTPRPKKQVEILTLMKDDAIVLRTREAVEKYKNVYGKYKILKSEVVEYEE